LGIRRSIASLPAPVRWAPHALLGGKSAKHVRCDHDQIEPLRRRECGRVRRDEPDRIEYVGKVRDLAGAGTIQIGEVVVDRDELEIGPDGEIGVRDRKRKPPGDTAPTISVNLSARQLMTDGVVTDVAEALRAYNLAPERLTLEITETFAVEDAEANRSTLEQLKAPGVQLAIDDFGSGYSSLGYLRRLPVDELKIDRGFVKALDTAPGDSLIVSAVTDLAHNLGMVVVAEGIEDARTVERVCSLGCDLGQGYFFAKPLPAALATAFLEMDGHTGALIASTTPDPSLV
jgi:EAL domain-containing protein (putative c-di-GMP-specific phosphodiesterase class I)